MADLWNYLVMEASDPKAVLRDTKEVLLARGWHETEATADGALSCSIWPAVGGLVVVELTDWEDVDLDLARALARLRKSPVAVSYSNEAGETETYAYFTCVGKKTKPPASALGKWASPDAWQLLPSGSATALSVQGPGDGATHRAARHLRHSILPVLLPLGFIRVRVEVRYHPQIDAVMAWAKSLNDGSRLLVRYDFEKGEQLRGCRQTIQRLRDGHEEELAILDCDVSAHWANHPELIERDFDMFAAELVFVLTSQLPQEQLLRSFAHWAERRDKLLADRRLLRVLEPGDVPARVLFRGQRLITVRAGELQLTFKFDTRVVSSFEPTWVGEIVELRGGERRARRLRVGELVLSFNDLGELLGSSRAV